MPPSPSLKRINPLSLHATNAYICPSCRARNVFNRIPRPRNSRLQAYPSTRRAASTITSVTAVNAKKDIPPAFQALHDALSGLQQEAAIYTNLSQLQLALRGLESENGVTRIALLGNHDGRATRRLARVLLADPLQPEPEWEKQITDIDDNDGRALLLRYAKRLELDQRHPLVRTLSLPSPTLQNHNIEILIQRVSTQPHESGLGARMYLTPGLEAPLSATGRFSTITYPVHKALIQARGLDGIQALLPPSSSKGSRVGDHMVTAVVDTPWTSLSADNQSTYSINPINLDRAEEAIRTFRKSLDNSFNYEHAWFESGMPRISAWLIDGTESLPAIVKPTNQRLIETLTANAEEAIDKEESEQLQEQASAVVPNSTRDLMNMYLAKWAEDAHTELRNHLDLAFTSKSWRKLTWWKLFWRVDDVTYITSDVLRQSWLVDADRSILYLAGRIEQAGLLPPLPENAPNKNDHNSNPCRDAPSSNDQPSPLTSTFGPPPSTVPFADLIPSSSYTPPPSPTTHPLSLSNPSKPIPSIAHTRQYLLATTIPPLQSLSQRLLLHALSTTFLTSSLSALLYVSISTTSVYEAGCIAAVGAVYAMRRLQKRWEGAREAWMDMCREEGRRVLRRVEEGWRSVIRDGGMGSGEDEGEREARERARRVVGRVREVLGGMERSGR